jgi:hypothetical protein
MLGFTVLFNDAVTAVQVTQRLSALWWLSRGKRHLKSIKTKVFPGKGKDVPFLN